MYKPLTSSGDLQIRRLLNLSKEVPVLGASRRAKVIYILMLLISQDLIEGSCPFRPRFHSGSFSRRFLTVDNIGDAALSHFTHKVQFSFQQRLF